MRIVALRKGSGDGESGPFVSFSPTGSSYSGPLVLTVGGTGVTKLRYKLGAGSWNNVSALTTTITVTGTAGGKDVYLDALSSSGTVLSSGLETYFTGGG